MSISEVKAAAELIGSVLFCVFLAAGTVAAVYAARVARLEHRDRLPPPEEVRRPIGFGIRAESERS
jgi:hypothetical protein